ncbi:sn-glycerol-3-phosphate transport system permease protein UgpE [Striga asiatica]|uniref:sn-glycerol-3-phosphate transport system permease protein UgpE n=1 Tax=Striga asiatica TaxID=4170 RepID=A0A5A7Q3Y4_STRAF|nr:sn-glycerol-3-phosphate transport system permease protein UgpE [Striga asiatica]
MRSSVKFDNSLIHEGSTPENSFLLVSNLPSSCNLQIPSGNSPENLFPAINETDCEIRPCNLLFEISRYLSLLKPHSPFGTFPESSLIINFFPRQRLGGSGPSKLLFDKSNCSRPECRPKLGGIFPDKLLLNSNSSVSTGLRAIASGIFPDRKLFFKWKDSTCRAARLAGIFPVRLFWEKSKRTSDVRLENVSGISPEM